MRKVVEVSTLLHNATKERLDSRDIKFVTALTKRHNKTISYDKLVDRLREIDIIVKELDTFGCITLFDANTKQTLAVRV